ncbi:hypothetical protein LOK49_LG14G02015 [Camellia lanceoleosa]|uniref:Uncharacterized protein n=1 Tax=Camellia lanceoleosa TaxID=1840588 RepID=A0ACC0FD64_9ERIC|nr:hypothetical protein LOK49_LG14G02015 [Camellia lanceoleosa]
MKPVVPNQPTFFSFYFLSSPLQKQILIQNLSLSLSLSLYPQKSILRWQKDTKRVKGYVHLFRQGIVVVFGT